MSHAAIMIPGIDRLGGAERQAITLATGLRRRGWRVTMVALCGKGGEAATALCEQDVGFVSLEMRKGLADPRGWIRLHRWLRREQPHVIHAHLPHAAWMARWSRLAAHIPVVIDTLHSSHTGKIGRKIGYNLSSRLPDCVTAVSQAVAAAHVAESMVCEHRLTVLANGLDVKAWKPDETARAETRRAAGLEDEFLWLAVGRLEPVKDYPTLLRAMALAPLSARLAILGDGPERADLEQLSRNLGLTSRVRFVGFEANVKRWMNAADGFVLSSRYEGLPMVLLEAGACGLPVVATDVPGTREALVHGDTGLLAKAGDPEALHAAMSTVMGMNGDNRRAMGERARNWVTERFGLEPVLDRWEALYAELLERDTAIRRIPLMAWESLKRRSETSA